MNRKKGVITTGEWIISMILMAIPCVNVITIIMWLISPEENLTKRNFAIAVGIMFLIGVAIRGALLALNIQMYSY